MDAIPSRPRYRHDRPFARRGLRPGTRSRSADLPKQCCPEGLPSPGRRSFFKSLLGRFIFLRMKRTWLQPGQTELAQPFADGPLGHFDGETASDLRAQIDAAPADHAMFLWIG